MADGHSTDTAAARTRSPARTPSKRHILWGAFLVILVPLTVLLALQYRWLTELERTSASDRQAQLERFLGRVTKDVRAFYEKTAERLSFHATILEPKYRPKTSKILKKKKLVGASRLFVVSFADKSAPYLLFDPESYERVPITGLTPELQAIVRVANPWSLMSKKGAVLESPSVLVDEGLPNERLLFNLITDEDSKVAGLVGMVVDQEYFRDTLIPKVVLDAWPASSATEGLAVVVRDDEGRAVWPPEAAGNGESAPENEISRPFSFLFTDWHIAVRGGTSTPQQWARSNFALNVTLSLVLAALLLGGLMLVLRTLAREMHLTEMKNDFVSNVSHELRTPLASIRVFGELLRHGRVSSPDKVQEYGEYIETESRRLTQLINNILDFSRIESGCRGYELEPADLEEVVADVLRTFEVRLRRSGFRIEVRGPEAPLPAVRLDADAIRQALFNLLDNAVKYSGEGRQILVCVRRQGDRAVVAVQDHGIGISRLEQERIFERFHRVGTRLVHDVKGTGLGLAIVQHIVRAHGGDVDLESEPGAGSTFSIRLPIEPGAPGEAGEPAAAGLEEPDLRLQQTG